MSLSELYKKKHYAQYKVVSFSYYIAIALFPVFSCTLAAIFNCLK